MSQRPQRGQRRGSSRAQAPGNVATNATADPVVNLSDAAAPAASVDIVVEGGDAQGHNDEEINAAAPEATVATSEGPARSGRANGTFSSTPLAQMFPGIVNPPSRGARIRGTHSRENSQATANPANNGNDVRDDANNHGNDAANGNNAERAEEATPDVFTPPSLAEIGEKISMKRRRPHSRTNSTTTHWPPGSPRGGMLAQFARSLPATA